MTTRRRGTFWMPFSEGAVPLAHAAGISSRLLIASIRETAHGREFEGYTVTRILFNMTITADAGNDNVVAAGIILLPSDVALANVGPADERLVDWMWQEEWQVGVINNFNQVRISRDIRSQRKARGGDTELYFYVENRDGANGLQVHRSGRVLVKRA